jgi:D-alanine-D-alanine ligase
LKSNVSASGKQKLLFGKQEMMDMNAVEDRKLKIAVLFGGRSGEHEVSLDSARSVLSVLDPLKYDIFQVGITHAGNWLTGPDARLALENGHIENLLPCTILPDPSAPTLFVIRTKGHKYLRYLRRQEKILEKLTDLDVVFPVLHGTYGEDGTLQGLLEMVDLAYVGAGVTGSSVGMDKGVFKDVMRAIGIPTVESVIVLRSEIEKDIEQVMRRAETVAAYPLFIKPANLGSSVGITKCNTHADLGEALLEAAAYDRRVLVERGVDAREIEVAVLGNDDPQASVPGEVLPSREFYSYESKYVDGTSGLLIPAPLPAELADQIRRMAITAYKAIDCAGMARVDFFLEKSTGALYLNELNSIPGFTNISMYPKLWEASGLPYAALVDRLVQLALERKTDRSHTERQFRRTS